MLKRDLVSLGKVLCQPALGTATQVVARSHVVTIHEHRNLMPGSVDRHEAVIVTDRRCSPLLLLLADNLLLLVVQGFPPR